MVKPKTDHATFETSSTTQQIFEKPEEPKPVLKNLSMAKPISHVTANVCANCDHLPNNHFDDPTNSFCTVIGCTCDSFRAYPT